MITLGALHREARRRLEEAGIENAALDARLLVQHLSGTTRADAIGEPGHVIDANAVATIEAALDRRLAHEPVHRILGWREFYGLKLTLSPETLEPRSDTETLVDLCLPFLKDAVAKKGSCRVLDLGTGTGALALALLSQIPQAMAVGTDISARALETAALNADMLGIGSRFSGLRSDWLDAVNGRFTLILSNPPYIPTLEVAGLGAEVREYDPFAALDGGTDGLDAYRAIAAGAAGHLDEGGHVAVETGFDQRRAVEEIFATAGFKPDASARDLGGNDRALIFSRR